jgi:hypothetical protein
MTDAVSAGPITPRSLRPYISLLFLQCTAGSPEIAFSGLTAFMRKSARRRQGAYTELRSGFASSDPFLRGSPEQRGFDQVDGFIYRIESSPSWAVPGSGYADVRNVLSIALRRGLVLAVYSEPTLRDAVVRWLRREPRPPLARVSQSVLQGAFLRGEAKGLWLHGTHARSVLRPDTKHITGPRVQDALSPLEDSSFAMSAAKSRLPDDPARTALLGVVGTVPRKGVLWNRQPQDFGEFLAACTEALELIEETAASGAPLDHPFPILAVESHDLSEVRGAYDILALTPDDLPTSTDITDEMTQAAEVLERAVLRVTGSPTSADFRLEVGLDGSFGGVLQATVRMSGDDAVLAFGHDPAVAPTNPGSVRKVLDALGHRDLLAVYYDSGHVVGPHGIGRRNVTPMPFENWQFLDFSGFDITVEKPGRTPSEIHSNIGSGQDTSLFGWVARYYSSGWLICDDGPGEVADFVHISPDGVLSMIHVKAAHSSSRSRGIAVSAFEVVTGQAAKNSRYLVDLDSLSETLMIPHDPQRASWIDGERVSGRDDFLAMIGGLMPSDKRQVVIVQPHVSEETYNRIRQGAHGVAATRDHELFRLNSLETLLHTTRGAAVALSTDLHVIGSKR